MRVVVGVVIFALVALAAWFVNSKTGRVNEVKAAITEGMRDPSSAQFRAVRKTSGGAVCGEVNAKNAMGGYVGFSRFVVTREDSYQFDPVHGMSADRDDKRPIEDRQRSFDHIWAAQCG